MVKFLTDQIHRQFQGVSHNYLLVNTLKNTNFTALFDNEERNMIVTFDSNIWRKIASPENFPKDPEFQINKRLNTLIKQKKINAYLSETIFTLEAVKKLIERIFLKSIVQILM